MLDRARFRGALLAALVGDVLGAPFEGRTGVVPAAELARVVNGSGVLRYTDDTAMMLALAESLVRARQLAEADLAARFAAEWSRSPQRGYSRATTALLQALSAGVPWQKAVAARQSTAATNGAAMRVAPVALAAAGDVDVAVRLARRSAAVTHPHPGAAAGAAVVAAAIARALRADGGAADLDPAGFVAELSRIAGDTRLAGRLTRVPALLPDCDAQTIATQLGTSMSVEESVPAALCAFLRHRDSFTDALTLAVRAGGDTDTIAAMAGAISGALLGEASIPAQWMARAESADRARRFADDLFALGRGG